MRRLFARLGLALVIVACTSPSEPVAPGVTLVPTASVYGPGELISATLANSSDVGYTYAACAPSLERREWRRWVVAYEDPRLCTGVLRVIPPQSSTTVTFQLPHGIVPGMYRLRLDIETSGDRRRRVVLSPRISLIHPD